MEIQNFRNAEFGSLRVIQNEKGEMMFCLADVCKALGIGNPSQIKTRLDGGDLISNEVTTMGKNQYGVFSRTTSMTFISEPNLYRCICAAHLLRCSRRWNTAMRCSCRTTAWRWHRGLSNWSSCSCSLYLPLTKNIVSLCLCVENKIYCVQSKKIWMFDIRGDVQRERCVWATARRYLSFGSHQRYLRHGSQCRFGGGDWRHVRSE